MRCPDPRYDLDRSARIEPSTELDGLLRRYLQAAEGALSRNTERALRADIAIFTAWCKDHAQVSLPVEQLEWIGLPGRRGGGSPASVIHRAGAVEIRRQGRVERLLGDVDPAGRMARLLIVIADPLNLRGTHGESDLPLLIGSYVAVEIHGRTLEDAIAVPRRALREVHGDRDNGAREGIWIMGDDGRLETRETEVIWRGEERVIVAGGLAAGERLIVSNIATPIEGMKLAVAGAGDAGG